ncbi:MAG: TetR/AcrR family transcriptional regulator C-terminal domain-containing protein [Sporolactobacillus sp.]
MTKPIAEITINDIINAAGISKQTFYNYFKDKNDTMIYAFKLESEEVSHKIDGHMENFINLLSDFLSKLANNNLYYYKIANYETQNNFIDYFYETTRKFYTGCFIKKYGMISQQIKSTIDFYSAGATKLIMNWIQNGMKEGPREMASTIFSCMPDLLKELT